MSLLRRNARRLRPVADHALRVLLVILLIFPVLLLPPIGDARVALATGDDFGSSYPFAFGQQESRTIFGGVSVATGSFSLSATDLDVHGRGVNFAFSRWYNSADSSGGHGLQQTLGPGWTNSFDWTAWRRPDANVEVHRGDGARLVYTPRADGSYAPPSGVREQLTSLGNGSYSLLFKDQTTYTFAPTTACGVTFTDYACLTTIRDVAGNHLDLHWYDPIYGMVVTSVSDTVGRRFVFNYTNLSANAVRLTAVAEDRAGGRRVTYGYSTDGNGSLITVTDALGNAPGQTPTAHQWHYAYLTDYAGSRHISTVTDPDGRVRVTNAYNDGLGRVTSQTDALGHTTTYTYGANFSTTVTDRRGYQTTFGSSTTTLQLYQEFEQISGTGYSIAYYYDSAGLLSERVDRLGGATFFTNDARGNVVSKRDATNATTSYTYGTNDQLTSVTDPRGYVTNNTYDTNGLLIDIARQIQGTTYAHTHYVYGDAANPGRATAVISPRGITTSNIYDPSGNLTSTTTPDGAQTTFAYDWASRRTSTTDPDGHTGSVAFDELDRVVRTTDALSAVTSATFDASGDQLTATDRRGNVTSYTYDGNALLQQVQQHPSGGVTYTTALTRDAGGKVTRVVDAGGAITDYGYDGPGRLTSMTTYPTTTGQAITYAFDANDRPTQRQTADGVAVTSAYDAIGRVTAVTGPGINQSYQFDPDGNRTQMVDATGTSTYQYDGLGRITQAATAGGTIGYQYDLDGNRTQLVYPGGSTVTSTYTNGGRLATVTDWQNRVTTYAYKPSGLVASVAYPNGLQTASTYDVDGRLTQLTNTIGTTTVTSHGYTLDQEGNRIQLAEYVSGITATGGTDVITYTYDGLNRLTGSTGAVTEAFALDGASNVTSRTGPGATFTFDGANRLRSDGTLTYSWSAADQLTSRAVTPPPPPPPPPGIAFRAQATANTGGGGTTLTISQPAGTQPGDVLLAFVYGGGGMVVAPSGWTDIDQQTYANLQLGRVFYHVAASSDPATWSWTFGSTYSADDHVWYANSVLAVGAIVGYSGVDPNAPISPATASANTGATAAIMTNAITTGYASEMVVASYGQLQVQGAAPTPAGWTTRVATSTGLSSGTMKFEDSLFAQAGWTNYLTWNSPNSGTWVAFMIGLKPAPPPPPPPPPPPGDTFTYNGLDRLTASTVSSVARTYVYNGDGLLQSRTQSATTTSLVWDPASLPSGLLQVGGDRVVYGLGPLYIVRADASTLTLARDGLGSVRAETSAAAGVTSAFRYSAYGALSSSSIGSPTLLGFAGEYRDPSALVYLRARWYDTATGRFTAHDSTPGDATRPLSLNPYTYAEGNPTLVTDPSGRCPLCLLLLAPEIVEAIGAVGATAGYVAMRYGPTISAWAGRLAMPAERVAEGLAKPTVTNPSLRNLVNMTYRTSATIGSGSTADLIREEVSEGQAVPRHLQKGLELINAYSNWLVKNPNESANDIAAANAVMTDTRQALSYQVH